ncbi:Mitochondrial outer membrane protein iml2 [Rhinocladiella similis]
MALQTAESELNPASSFVNISVQRKDEVPAPDAMPAAGEKPHSLIMSRNNLPQDTELFPSPQFQQTQPPRERVALLQVSKETAHPRATASHSANGFDIPRSWQDLAKIMHEKLGFLTIAIFLVGIMVILAIMSLWTFLWFGNGHNSAWQWIMEHDSLKVIVSSTAEVANKVAILMIGFECSMLIALALEWSDIRFSDIAAISIGRAGGGQGLSTMKKISKFRLSAQGVNLVFLMTVTAVLLLQMLSAATHTVLLADVSVAKLPTSRTDETFNISFNYYPQTISNEAGFPNLLYRSPAWSWKAPSYPAFAEYSEDPYQKNGISDTGLTLRAFLPIADPLVRQKIRSYSGRATVFDARVTCQVPDFDDISVEVEQDSLLLSGYVKASQSTPRLGNITLVPTLKNRSDITNWTRNAPVPFICVAPLANMSTYGIPDQWRTVLCQLTEAGRSSTGIAGGLVSEFNDYSSWLATSTTFNNSWDFGTAYLVFNVTSGPSFLWEDFFKYQKVLPIPITARETSKEWKLFTLATDLSFGATLCYSALDTAEIPVEITSESDRNVTEPAPSFNFGSKRYEFQELRRQYGQSGHHGGPHSGAGQDLGDRGVLTLKKQSWTVEKGVQPPTEPFLRSFANLAGSRSNGGGNDPYWSGFLWSSSQPYDLNLSDHYWSVFSATSANYLQPDPLHIWLFQDIIAHGGSVAFALQSLFTLLVSMAYYDQLPQFDKATQVDQSLFKYTNLPTHYRGLLIVMCAFTVHLVLAYGVLAWFVLGTRYTRLGQKWQAMVQANTPETSPYLAQAVTLSDKEFVKYVEEQGGQNTLRSRVKLGPHGESGRIGFYVVG